MKLRMTKRMVRKNNGRNRGYFESKNVWDGVRKEDLEDSIKRDKKKASVELHTREGLN